VDTSIASYDSKGDGAVAGCLHRRVLASEDSDTLLVVHRQDRTLEIEQGCGRERRNVGTV
jgi:hypothetical protein